MIKIKNIHEKLLSSIQTLLIDTKINLPYYGEFNLHVNFHEQESIGTCAVNVTTKGMNFYYSPSFLKDLSQKEVNFITLHEDFHLIFNHPRRTITGQYNHKLANIAQDMIINYVIWEDISHSFVEIPKSKDGKNMALFPPDDYKGKLIFEELYEYLKEEKEKFDKAKQEKQEKQEKEQKEKGEQGQGDQGQSDESGQESQGGQGDGQESGGKNPGEGDGQGSESKESNGKGKGKSEKSDGQDGEGDAQDGEDEGDKLDQSGNKSYGPYGKNPKSSDGKIDTWSLDKIFEDMDTNNGEYLDKHITDEVPEEMKEALVRDVMDRLAARGLSTGNIDSTLNKLRKKRKDYLKEIKRNISNQIFGTTKTKTISRPNRRQIPGLKGNKKVKDTINVILDTSGSMGGQGTFERVLSYVYRDDIEVNLMESDTQVKWVETIKSKKKLASIPIKGLGGTCLNPAIDYVRDKFNSYNTVILTDGMTDRLNFQGIKGRVLIISIAGECPIAHSNGKIKQICIGDEK